MRLVGGPPVQLRGVVWERGVWQVLQVAGVSGVVQNTTSLTVNGDSCREGRGEGGVENRDFWPSVCILQVQFLPYMEDIVHFIIVRKCEGKFKDGGREE